MKLARLLPLLLISTLAISACGKDETTDAAAGSSSKNNLLTLVPANTPYLGGSLAPVPDTIIDSYLKRFEPALTSLQVELNKAKLQREANPDELADDPAARIAHVVLLELDGKLNRAGLESLGFDISSQSVVYGMSAFPVARMSLSDAATLRATVQRVLDSAEVKVPSHEFQGQSYWRFIPEMHDYDENGDVVIDGDEKTDDPADAIGFYLAILEDHMVLGMLPVFAESSFLPALLALEKPASSSAESTLMDINRRFAYTPHGSGVIDFQKLADEITNPDSMAGQFVSRSGHDLAELNTDQCRQEINTIIAHTPRAYSGIKEFSETLVGSQIVVENESSLAAELVKLVADVPVANAKSSFLAEFALGIKTGPLRDFLRSKTTAIIEQPYQCAVLAQVNEQAQNANDQLNQPLPPLVNNLLGLRVAISRFGRGQSAPESAEGLIALHVTQPEMLIGMAQMLLPNLADLNMAAGEPAVRVPADMIPMPDLVLYAAQSTSAIGISVGEGEQNALLDFINQAGKANGTFLSVNYDMATYMDITGQMGADDSVDDKHFNASNIAKQFQEVQKQVMDRSDTRLSFTKDGFVMDSKLSFKNP
ncbi:MAG: hypothetical protein SH820_18525 [Xanthomonadales bacterium]|nr:hypothetical protein [Xanthomonadales bacterium]